MTDGIYSSQQDAEDHRWMQHALMLAKRGLYTTRPNPAVGCVLVKDGKIIGEGFHPKAGEMRRAVQQPMSPWSRVLILDEHRPVLMG
jgi:tRNA(Arg) A34 adenosine deaminase TadA